MNKTALYDIHKKLDAKLVDFAGYQMPITYPAGNLKEHEWVRSHAGIFDVSHMGQALLEGEKLKEFISYITPSSFHNIDNFHAKYTVLTKPSGGIIDDLIFTCINDNLFFVVYNAGCKEKDEAWIREQLPDGIIFTPLPERSLIALQGPTAEQVLCDIIPEHKEKITNQPYMTLQYIDIDGLVIYVSRLGYTGEDGFELSIPNNAAEQWWTKLLDHKEVQPIGLAARDSLRQEMGYPLYGHDITEDLTPVEANLNWLISKEPTDFIGKEVIIVKQREQKPTKKRVGIVLDEKGIPREGHQILSENKEPIGSVTSGVFSPTLKQGIAQGYVPIEYGKKDTTVYINIRGKHVKGHITLMPFTTARTKTTK